MEFSADSDFEAKTAQRGISSSPTGEGLARVHTRKVTYEYEMFFLGIT